MPSNSVSLQRRVAWMDTDAAGVWHNSAAIRWAEEAEAELHRRLGIVELTFGATPRVRMEFEFSAPLVFDDVIDIILTVAELGRTSITYLITVQKGGELAVSGTVIAVFIDRDTGAKRPWTDELRQALSPGA